MWTLLFVPTKRNRGHIGSNPSGQRGGNEEEASNSQGATRDHGRNVVVARRHPLSARLTPEELEALHALTTKLAVPVPDGR